MDIEIQRWGARMGAVLRAEIDSALLHRISDTLSAAVLALFNVDVVHYRLHCLEFFGFLVRNFDIKFFF
jgi:hypothetical protein